MTWRADRPGSALLVVLLGLLLIEAMVLGSLAIATSSASSARIAGQRLHARLTAESAVREGVGQWVDRDGNDPAAGTIERRTSSRVEGGHIEIEALGGGRYMIRGRAPAYRVDRVLAQVLVHTIPRDSLRILFDAALHVHGAVRVSATSSIDGTGSDALESCDVTPVPGIIAPPFAAILETGAILDGAPPLHETFKPPTLNVAGFPFEVLHELADTVVAGTPPADALCPQRSCLVYAPADLTLSGGAGHGMLVVPGRLRLIGNARFTGAVLAGALELANGHITGAVHVLGTDTTRIDGTIRFHPCAIENALAATGLRRPFRRGARLWLPAR